MISRVVLSHLKLSAMDTTQDDIELKQPETERIAIVSPPLNATESPPPIVARDGGWGWCVVFGSMLTHIIIGGQERANGILYLAIINKFHRSSTLTAGLLSFTTSFQLLCGPISGALIKRFCGRKVGVIGGFLLFLSFLISSFASSVDVLFFSYAFIGGIAKSLSYTSSIIMVGYYFDKRRGIAVGLTTSGVGIGTFMYAPFMEWAFKTYSFFGTMLLLGGIALNLCVCGMLYRPLKTKTKKLRLNSKEGESLTGNHFNTSIIPDSNLIPHGDLDDAETSRTSCQQKFISKLSSMLLMIHNGFDFQLLCNLHFLFFCFNICLFTASHWSIPVFLPAFSLERGIHKMEAALLISIIGISDMISRILMGIILDLKWIRPYRRLFFTAVVSLQVIMMFSCSYATKFWEFALICVTYGSLCGGTIAQLSIIVVDLLGVEKLASSFGWILCFQGIGVLIGPTLSGKIRDSYKNYSEVYFFAGGMMLMGLIFLLISAVIFWWEKRGKQSTETA